MSFNVPASGFNLPPQLPLVASPPSFNLISLLLVVLNWSMLLIKECNAGCYQQRMCCAGHNHSCKARDDGLSPYSPFQGAPQQQQRGRIKLFEMKEGEQFPSVFTKNDEKIGRLILPDMIELQGLGVDYAHKLGHRDYLRTYEQSEFTDWGEDHVFIFGMEQADPPMPEKVLFHEKGRPLIRYSLLNKHISLRVGKVKRIAASSSIANSKHLPLSKERVVMYLSDPDSDCFCDEFCVQMGDCCSDYSFVCPPADCQISGWSGWSECRSNQKCGGGSQQRSRIILGHPSNGGKQCPDILENRACFRDCATPMPPRSQLPSSSPYYFDRATRLDITTVALLLDYHYNSSRLIRNSNSSNIYWDAMDRKIDRSKNIYYCVQYELGWVNRNCVEQKWKSKLFKKNVICGECQPEAQLHRNSPRCASDLEDNEKGFWKLIGPPSCSGIWRRISRTDNCKCYEKYPSLTPFLMV